MDAAGAPGGVEAARRSLDPLPPGERGPRIPEHLPVVRGNHRVRAWESLARSVAVHRRESHRATRLRVGALFQAAHRATQVCAARAAFCRPIIALLQTLQERCLAAPGPIAAIMVGKYCDHLPLYRQEQIFAPRHGVKIPRQTMAQWMGLAAHWLRLSYEHIRPGILGDWIATFSGLSATRRFVAKVRERQALGLRVAVEFAAPDWCALLGELCS